MTRRTDRLGELFREEIASLLEKGIKDPRIGFVTVNRCEVTEDLSHATVWVGVLGDEKNKRDSLIGLKHTGPWIRSLLFKKMKIRKIPEFHFVLDEGVEHSLRISEILEEMKRNGELPSDPTPSSAQEGAGG